MFTKTHRKVNQRFFICCLIGFMSFFWTNVTYATAKSKAVDVPIKPPSQVVVQKSKVKSKSSVTSPKMVQPQSKKSVGTKTIQSSKPIFGNKAGQVKAGVTNAKKPLPATTKARVRAVGKKAPSGVYLPDTEVISLVKQAVYKHERWGSSGLQKVSETCYFNEVNKSRCLYFDLASRKIDSMVAQAFNQPLNQYFADEVFGSRLLNVFTVIGRDAEQANEFLRIASPQVNSFVVQKVKLSSFMKWDQVN